MTCTLVYGFSCNWKYIKEVSVTEAFRFAGKPVCAGYAFIDIYYNQRLVYTTQGAAGIRYICEDCPYYHKRT